MNIENLEQIIKIMESSDTLSELNLEVGDFKLGLKRMQAGQMIAPMPMVTPLAQPAVTEISNSVPSKPTEEKGMHYIKAPMVGTFYSSPSPDSPAFIKKGDRISSDTVVCILEAMKVMNEIHAECSGEIIEVLSSNGNPVEYGQMLFKVKLDTV